MEATNAAGLKWPGSNVHAATHAASAGGAPTFCTHSGLSSALASCTDAIASVSPRPPPPPAGAVRDALAPAAPRAPAPIDDAAGAAEDCAPKTH